jgi:hypothetical protein
MNLRDLLVTLSRSFALALSLVGGSVTVTHAAEAGDVFALGNGPGYTVTSIRRTDRNTFEVTARVMDANAAEFCERYQELTLPNPKAKKCIEENRSSSSTKITVNCRTSTIILDSGSYRPGVDGGPWVSVANPNWIVQGGSLFRLTCNRR